MADISPYGQEFTLQRSRSRVTAKRFPADAHQSTYHSLKLDETVLNRQTYVARLLWNLARWCGTWVTARSWGVGKINFRSKPKLPTAPYFVRNLNSSALACIWAACISKRNKISELWNKRGERRWSPYALPKFNEVWFTNRWEPPAGKVRTLKIEREIFNVLNRWENWRSNFTLSRVSP